MSNKDGKYRNIFDKFTIYEEIKSIGKILGRGAFGEVREINYNGKILAGKLLEKDKNEKSPEELYFFELRGKNIVKTTRIYSKEINNIYYDLIIMEKAILRDLGKLNEFYHKNNLLKLIYIEIFDEKASDNILRFYARQIIDSLELLNRNNFVHFDFKPENLLVGMNLILKLCDFSILRKLENDEIKLPGGTPGYITPEYYIDKSVPNEIAKKQDYFALGSILFILKFGKQLIRFKKYEESKMNYDRIIDLLQRNIAFLKSQIYTDKDFIKFVIHLIQYKPEDRPSFEAIYRSKWLNKNNKELEEIINAFQTDEEKLLMELQKKDFLIKKEKLLLKEKNSNSIKFRFKKKEIKV